MIPDYSCEPLWSDDIADYVSAADLCLSSSLGQRLEQWQATYDSILDLQEPYNTGFRTPEEEAAFEQEGLRLACQIQAELGDEYQVYYRDAPVRVTA